MVKTLSKKEKTTRLQEKKLAKELPTGKKQTRLKEIKVEKSQRSKGERISFSTPTPGKSNYLRKKAK